MTLCRSLGNVLYASSLFWALAILISSETQMEIVPTTLLQVGFVCALLLVGAACSAVIFGSIFQAIQQANFQHNAFQTKLHMIEDFVSANAIHPSLAKRLKRQIKLNWLRTKAFNTEAFERERAVACVSSRCKLCK